MNRSTTQKSGIKMFCLLVLFVYGVKRFSKKSDNPQSVGLGLSIVKKITETCKMEITYTCTGNIHELRLDFFKAMVSEDPVIADT